MVHGPRPRSMVHGAQERKCAGCVGHGNIYIHRHYLPDIYMGYDILFACSRQEVLKKSTVQVVTYLVRPYQTRRDPTDRAHRLAQASCPLTLAMEPRSITNIYSHCRYMSCEPVPSPPLQHPEPAAAARLRRAVLRAFLRRPWCRMPEA
eukprot:scaffold4174_cov122-Isochrysis_galbana.AAC.11